MDRLAGDGAGGGRPTVDDETVVDEPVVGVLLLLLVLPLLLVTAAVDVEVVVAVGAEEDGLLLFRWLALALAEPAALLLASADVSPDPGPLLVPLTGSCCDGGVCTTTSERKQRKILDITIRIDKSIRNTHRRSVCVLIGERASNTKKVKRGIFQSKYQSI